MLIKFIQNLSLWEMSGTFLNLLGFEISKLYKKNEYLHNLFKGLKSHNLVNGYCEKNA